MGWEMECTSQNSRCYCPKNHASHKTCKSWKAKGEFLTNLLLFIRERNLSQNTQQTTPQVPWARIGSCAQILAAREAGVWYFEPQLWEMESTSRGEIGLVGKLLDRQPIVFAPPQEHQE